MSTSTDRQMYRVLVAQVAEKARAILPDQTNGRIEAAVKLVLQGDVLPQADGSVQVGSSDPTRYYVLTGQACTCTDFVQERAPSGWCKHRISAGILKRVTELLPQEPDQAAATTAGLPEAPASCNVRLMVQGREVQWTLRDTDETRLAARLEALLARYPVEQSAPDQPTPEATPRACPIHQVLMIEQHNARGAWWSHRQADGSWCKGKGREVQHG